MIPEGIIEQEVPCWPVGCWGCVRCLVWHRWPWLSCTVKNGSFSFLGLRLGEIHCTCEWIGQVIGLCIKVCRLKWADLKWKLNLKQCMSSYLALQVLTFCGKQHLWYKSQNLLVLKNQKKKKSLPRKSCVPSRLNESWSKNEIAGAHLCFLIKVLWRFVQINGLGGVTERKKKMCQPTRMVRDNVWWSLCRLLLPLLSHHVLISAEVEEKTVISTVIIILVLMKAFTLAFKLMLLNTAGWVDRSLFRLAQLGAHLKNPAFSTLIIFT